MLLRQTLTERNKHAQKRKVTVQMCVPPVSKRPCSQTESTESASDQLPILTATPDKTLAQCRGSPAYSEAEVSYVSNASGSASEPSTSRSCSGKLSFSPGVYMTSE